MSENMKALRAAFKAKLGDVKKKARRMRAESLLEDDEDEGGEEETMVKVSKKMDAPDADSPKKEEKEPLSEKLSEMRGEVENFLTKPRKIDVGKTKVVIASPGPKGAPRFGKSDGDKKKGKK